MFYMVLLTVLNFIYRVDTIYFKCELLCVLNDIYLVI